MNNAQNGILIEIDSDDNTIMGNTLTNNDLDGIKITASNNNTISYNTITDNGVDGIYLNNSSATINVNRIAQNGAFGLYNKGNGIVDAENNWWGSNTPNISSNGPSDINILGGTVSCDQWILLKLNSSCDRSNLKGSNYKYIISADLTHNNEGRDIGGENKNTGTDNNLPDGIPIFFNTTIGNIATTVPTVNGKSKSRLSSSTTGQGNVSITLDNQTLTIPVYVTSIDVYGVHNTRTGEGYNTIQSAIDSNTTRNGDTLTLADGTYTENVIIYKKLTIKPISGAKVTVQAEDSDKSIFSIMNDNSSIQDITITGSNSYGIVSYYANNIYLHGNTILGNNIGIFIFNSTTTLSDNNISNNWYGLYIEKSINTKIFGGRVSDNWYGILEDDSTYTKISGLNITNNWYGIKISDSSNTTISSGTITDSWYGLFIENSLDNQINGNILKNNFGGIYSTNSTNNISNNEISQNQGGIIYDESKNMLSGNNLTNNSIANISEIDTTNVIMQTNIYNCGPACLAMILKGWRINVTQEEIADMSETDGYGTTLYGLKIAAQNKGLNATGMIFSSIDQLAPGNIILLNVEGIYHYSLISKITSTTVYLADPSFGNIQLSISEFTEMYSGYTLVITNGTNLQLNNGTVMSNDEMQNINGNGILLDIVGGYFPKQGNKYGFNPKGFINALRGFGAKILTNGLKCLGPVGFFIGTIASIEPVGSDNPNDYYQYQSPTNGNYHGCFLNPFLKSPYRDQKVYDRYTKTGYVSVGGYVYSTKSLEQIIYEQKLAIYENKIKSQIAKIGNKDYDINPDVQRGLNKVQEIRGLTIQGTGGDKDPDESDFILGAYKKYKEYINEGMEDIKAGNHVKGLAKIGMGASWLVTMDVVSISVFVDTMWPSGFKLENFYLNNTNQSS